MDIIINSEKCINCLLCTKDCVAGVFRKIDNTATVSDSNLCNRCSHCLSVCPEGAITHEGLDSEQIIKINKKQVDDEIYAHIIKSRRSIRQYKDKSISREQVSAILQCTKYSPTASNEQNVEYKVILDRTLIRKISHRIFSFALKANDFFENGFGSKMKKYIPTKYLKYLDGLEFYREEAEKNNRDFILHNAPCLILIMTPKRANFGDTNCNIAATNLMNYAHSMGLGSCYIGFLLVALKYDRKLKNWMDIPKNKKVNACVILGHPLYPHTSTVSRKKPVIHYL